MTLQELNWYRRERSSLTAASSKTHLSPWPRSHWKEWSPEYCLLQLLALCKGSLREMAGHPHRDGRACGSRREEALGLGAQGSEMPLFPCYGSTVWLSFCSCCMSLILYSARSRLCPGDRKIGF